MTDLTWPDPRGRRIEPHTDGSVSPSGLTRSLDPRRFSFGSPAAIVTSIGLIVGLDTATQTKAAVIGSLLIIGLADNLTDSLSVHMYQEAEDLAHRQAFGATVSNFMVRAVVTMTFVALFLLLPPVAAVVACVAWGFLLLSAISWLIAHRRGVRPLSEICKHAAVAGVAIGISKLLGILILRITGTI